MKPTEAAGASRLEVEPQSERTTRPCACCGRARKVAWGFVYRDGGPHACYFVEWTLGADACAARVDVVVGSWLDGTTEDDREAVSLDVRLGDRALALADARGRPAAEIGRARTPAEVAGTPTEREARAIAIAVLEADDRVGAPRAAAS